MWATGDTPVMPHEAIRMKEHGGANFHCDLCTWHSLPWETTVIATIVNLFAQYTIKPAARHVLRVSFAICSGGGSF